MPRPFSALAWLNGFLLLCLLGLSSPGWAQSWKRVPQFGTNPGALKMYEYKAASYRAGAPLVIVLHGCHQDAKRYAEGSGWSALADQFGFLLIAPEQVSSNHPLNCFNWFNAYSLSDYMPYNWAWFGSDIDRGSGEAQSIMAMIDTALETHQADPKRVFISGLSAGGAMSVVMLAAYPERFAGGAPIAGVPYKCAIDAGEALDRNRCGLDYLGKAGQASVQALPPRAWGDKVRAANPAFRGPWPRVSIWHGTADQTVVVADAEAILKQWLDVQALDAASGRSAQHGRLKSLRFADQQGRHILELNLIDGMGHGTPIRDGQCGKAGDYLIDVGICASRLIADFWGITSPAASR